MVYLIFVIAVPLLLALVWIVWTAIEAYTWSRPGTIKAEIFTKTGDSIAIRAVATGSGEDKFTAFNYKGVTYVVENLEASSFSAKVNGKEQTIAQTRFVHKSRVASGLVTVNKLHYLSGIANPIDWGKLEIGNIITAEEVKIARENHIVAEAFKAWAQSVISPLMTVILIGAIVLISAFGVYKALDSKINSVVAAQQNVIVPPSDGGFNGNLQ